MIHGLPHIRNPRTCGAPGDKGGHPSTERIQAAHGIVAVEQLSPQHVVLEQVEGHGGHLQEVYGSRQTTSQSALRIRSQQTLELSGSGPHPRLAGGQWVEPPYPPPCGSNPQTSLEPSCSHHICGLTDALIMLEAHIL